MDPLTPQIISTDIDAARKALKLSCFYFERTLFDPRALYARPTVGEQMRANNIPIHYRRYHEAADVAAFLDSLSPLVESGLLSEAPSPPPEVVSECLLLYSEIVWSRQAVSVEKFRRLGFAYPEEMVDFAGTEMAFGATMMDLSTGCPTSPDLDILGWFSEGYREALGATWASLPDDDKARHRRDALATQAIQQLLPNVATMEFEDLLRLRDRQKDNLLRFRAEMGSLVSGLEPDQDAKHFDAFVTRTIEEKVQPAVVELQAQLDDLKRTSWVKAVGGAPAAGFALMGVSALSAAPLPLQIGAGMVGAVAAVAHAAVEHRAAKKAKLAHPFAMFLKV